MQCIVVLPFFIGNSRQNMYILDCDQWRRQGGGGSWCSSSPFLAHTIQEVYLKDPAEHGATSFVSGLSEVVACLPVELASL